MSDIEEATQNLAYIAAMKKILADAEAVERQKLLASGKRRTEHPVDDLGSELATVAVKYSDSNPKPMVSILDPAAVLPWAVEEFGESAMDANPRLSEQGKTSVIEYARRVYLETGGQVPGVATSEAPDLKLIVSVTPKKNVIDLVKGMASRNAVSFADFLALESPSQEDRP